MQGIAAITANNGWAMAVAGASIVMAGLAILSFVISQLHKIIALLEGKKEAAPAPIIPEPAEDPQKMEIDLLVDLPTAARIYSSLAVDLGECFPLASLYRVFEKENVPHPHITISAFRHAGLLVRGEEGDFFWKNLEE